MKNRIVALDLGGTWMKGAAARAERGCAAPLEHSSRKPNPLAHARSAEAFATVIVDFCLELTGGEAPGAVVAATAGEVDAAGRGYLCAGAHLGVMGTTPWAGRAAERLGCPFKLVNDAEAFVLGAAARGHLPTRGNVGSLVIGTGLGFSLVRKGRWWKPFRRLIHLGAGYCPGGDYNELVSAVRATERNDFAAPGSRGCRDYIEALAGVTAAAVNLFHLDTVFLGGGAVDAARSAGWDLAAAVGDSIAGRLLPGYAPAEIVALEEGNRVILEGALALAAGDLVAEASRFTRPFGELATEVPDPGPGLETFPPVEIARRLAEAESQAAEAFTLQAPLLARGAEMAADALRRGGRIVYLGAGTSGRIGALDAVEIPCTFGLPDDRFVAVIAGGCADATLTIEDQFEEDTSSVADLLLLGLRPEDLVIGLSASGSAFFVRSGLGYARARGAGTILLHEGALERELADLAIGLKSGRELVAGSTRMKAGTATKKALNVLSTTTMVLLGKVRGGEMIDLHCCNAKLQERALRILTRLGGISREQARERLVENDYRLRDALDALE